MLTYDALPDPAVADATAFYRLSLDDRLYRLDQNGLLWLPAEAPGWPRRDGAYDTDFEAGETAFTWVNQQSCTTDWGALAKSKLLITATTSHDSVRFYKRSCPAGLTDKRAMACFCFQPDFLASAGGTAQDVGIGVKNTSSGKIISIVQTGFYQRGSGFLVMRHNTETSWSATPFSAAYASVGHNMPVVLAIWADASTIYFEYAPYIGGSESKFMRVYSESLATFIGTGIDEMGLIIYKGASGSGNKIQMLCDWLRVIDA